MEVVIDAQVVIGYFDETVREVAHRLTESAVSLINRLGVEDCMYIDERGMLEYEYADKTGQEWLNAWIGDLLRDGGAQVVPARPHQALERRLAEVGFPVNSRDKWYVRVARSVVEVFGSSHLVSEDLHFFAPREKGSAGRNRRDVILRNRLGPVPSCLARETILVHCVATYLADAGS